MPGDDSAEFDLARVLAEIEEDVRLRRAAGDYPLTLDRELDELFESLSPAARSSQDFIATLERAEAAAFIDVDVPTASDLPGGSAAKAVMAKGMRWFGRHLAQQTTVFASAATRALRLLGTRTDALELRVEALEREASGRADRVRTALAGRRRPMDLSDWTALVTENLDPRLGRVLHAHAGDGSLVEALVQRGIDAYGVEPDELLASAAMRRALDVRVDEAIDHLDVVDRRALGGVVLSGCVDELPAASLLELGEAAARAICGGGRLIILSSAPETWGSVSARVEADLAPGRPLHAETWELILLSNGFTTSAEGVAARSGTYALVGTLSLPGDG